MNRFIVITMTLVLFAACRKNAELKQPQPNNPANEIQALENNSSSQLAELSQARGGLCAASAGNHIYFAGGYADPLARFDISDRVDIYKANGQWSYKTLSEPRYDLAGAGHGNWVAFGGGLKEILSFPIGLVVVSKAVDIYNISTGEHIITELSLERRSLAAAAAGNKIVFAGGFINSGSSGPPMPTDAVDIYDIPSRTWSAARLSQPRGALTGVAAGNKIFFAGGVGFGVTSESTRIDVFDAETGIWTIEELSQPRRRLAAASANNKVLFAGGLRNLVSVSNTVDIYDLQTNTWSVSELSQGRSFLTATSLGSMLIFAGGNILPSNQYTPTSDNVDVYHTGTGSWTVKQLSISRSWMASGTTGNKVVIAGGQRSGTNSFPTAAVDIFTSNDLNN